LRQTITGAGVLKKIRPVICVCFEGM